MPEIPAGARGHLDVEVTEANAISFLRLEEARVLATPWMIMYMEMTARDAVKPYLSDGEDTVGTHVNVRHLSATPIGGRVRFEAEVIRIDGRRIEFRVTATEGEEIVGDGTHQRAIIDVRRFADRIQQKR